MVKSLDTSSKLAIDAQGLEQLRAQAQKNPDQALKAAAQQFESVFLNMMLKSMREATPQDGAFDSEQTKMFTGMLDQQLAQNMSGKGVGLAEVMIRQLSGGMPALNGAAQPANPVLQTVNPAATLKALQSAYNDTGGNTANTQTVQQDFVNRMLPLAKQVEQTSGVPAQLTLGQAALESGWGKREIRMADGSNSYNLFGIKANAGWTGKVAEVMTTEYTNGVASRQAEKFRAYNSYAEAFKDYASMLGQNPRYADALQQGNNTAAIAQAMQKAGYATDPKYADKLTQVMNKINLAG